MTYGKPFSRLAFLKNVSYFIEKGWGSYNELIEMTVKDFIEIRVGLESKMNEEKIQKSVGGGT